MNKTLKYGLLGAGAAVAVAVAGTAYLAATFDPNDYKDRIIRAVKESRQRDLRLDGRITLSFFPDIGANVGKASLSEFDSDKPFAAIDSARISLALLPLLSGQAVVNEVAVSGLQATLVRHRDGTMNIDDLLDKGKQDGKPPVRFDIAAVSLEKTALTYRDEASGAQYAIKGLSLHTGRIANGVPGKIDLSAGVQANQPKLDINTRLKATLTFDLDRQQYRLEGLDLQADGSALDIGNLKVRAGGDVNADLARQEFGAQKFSVSTSGTKAKEAFEATLDAPALSLTQDKFSGDNLTLDLDMKQPEQAFKVKLASALAGNFQARQFDLGNLVLALDAAGDRLPGKSISSEMRGSVRVDAAKETVQADLAGSLLQSRVKARFGVNGFADPAIRFDVDVDQFDADLYLPKKSHTASARASEPERPIDLSALRKLKLDGSLRIGSLKAANVKATNVRLDVKGGLKGLFLQ